ncbi:hypothetical protein O6H91_14G081000 [Diphasiastrum complanatum]|uniref:Uncharacterized protein n=4 Tax=Diphasiastrum complanatum TaxID=34168 RepID=A0ACC2BS84_DIPCM|nr:hypothetical protein O6H91_14G081000 [Diphasiastrum complanatum]KAJ7532286.1 hypothetical protein O6H91_14G081000 [Diphasiastrum complanatum]KAJ7532290.1 hypothetical protein O6H91_14G081000 [Diphasiastrum complanatum]KAJ7532292.1 hypothetical protein O6H91_14G081000 [Diphasiastrum complanatum]
MFGSTTPFGSSSPGLFGSASASSSPFSASTTTNPFGATQAANPFAAKPFGTTSFGGQTGSSLFGSGTATGVFGATQASAFGASTPAFGATSTPAFGSTPSPFGTGSSLFGQKPASPFGSFGTTQGQANPFGSPSFGQTQAAFGTQPFASTPAFGATPTPAFGTTPAFGASTPSFGASSTPTFGVTPTPAFGSTSPAFGTTSVFGQSAPAFGASTTPAFGSTSVFGSTTVSPFGSQTAASFGAPATPTFGSSPFGTSPFTGGQRAGSRSTPYAVTNDADAAASGQAGKLMSISAMPAYKNKSVEELRFEDYQAGDKGGPNPNPQSASGGIFGQTPSSSPFAAATGFGQTSTPNPFAASTSSSLFAPKPASGIGALTTPSFGSTTTAAFGSSFGSTPSIFGTPTTTPAFGTGSAPVFGSSTPFGATSSPGFGASPFGSTGAGTSIFGSSTPAFGSSSSFSSTSAFNASSSPFGASGLFGNTQSSGLFSTPFSQPFGTSTSAFGATTAPAFGSNLFGSGSSSSIFSSKPAGLSQSTPSLFANYQSSTPGQTPGAFNFSTFGQGQPVSNALGLSPAPAFGQSSFGQQLVQNPLHPTPISISNPFGALPAMPQMSIGRTAGTGPSVQYGISTLPVSDKPTQVRLTSLLTPRHITPRSKIRMHARRYHPKKDGQKVPFFSDDEETILTPKADVLFVPRENPRALFIRQTNQVYSPPIVSKGVLDARELDTPVLQDDIEVQDTRTMTGGSIPSPKETASSESWQDHVDVHGSPTSTVEPSKSAESPMNKQPLKQNGVRDEHNHRSNGYISMTGHRAGEAAIAYEHGADIEALMPKLRHSDYYTEPRIQELAAKERAMPGYCRRVINFVVGRRDYGHVKFLGETDVRRLDLESIIQFNKCEVLVYMDESKKPPVGQGLNKPAEVTLLNVKCVDKKTGHHFSEGPEVEKFEKRLKKKTEEQGAEFISYNATKGEWSFKVKHFSRYGLDNSDDDEVPNHDTVRALIPVGLDLMEGIEESTQVHRREVFEPEDMRTPILSDFTDEEVDVYDEEEIPEEMQGRVLQAALPHSLPSQLRLDPVKMHQMRTLFFTLDEETEDVMMSEGYGKFNNGNLHQELVLGLTSSLKAQNKVRSSPMHGSERAAWPKRSPWKGVPSKQMRLSPNDFWQKVPALPLTNVCHFGGRHWEGDIISDSSAAAFGTSNGVTTPSKHSKGFRLETTSNQRLLCDSRSDLLADAALCLGTSFRVGWGPHGLFVHSGTPAGQQVLNRSLSSLIHIEKVSLDRTVRDEHGTVTKDLVELQFVSPLLLHMSMSKANAVSEKNRETSLILRNLVCNPTEVSRLCDRYEELIEKQHMTKGLPVDDRLVLRHQVMAWQLLAVLFSEKVIAEVTNEHDKEGLERKHEAEMFRADPEADILTRRAEFSSWLQDSVMHLVQEELRSSAADDPMEEIFTLLTGRQLDHAVEKSIRRGDVRMACLLSQAGGSVSTRQDIALQLDVWESESLDQSLIEGTKFSILKLLSGDLLGALKDRTIDWKRFLGMLMWYQLAADKGLPDIFNEYCKLLHRNEAPVPVPMYVEETSDRSIYETSQKVCDICYYLMLLHATENQEVTEMDKMFSSQSSTFDTLDHRLAWHQRSLLQAIGVLGSLKGNLLDMSFVAQLLSVGLIDWAVYVVLHMPPTPEFPGLHEKAIKEILGQYCEIWSMSEKQQYFLEKELKVPSAWLHESLAVYWKYAREPVNSLQHLLRSSQWQSAHVLFMTSVAALLFMKGEHATIWRIVNEFEENKLEIENWELGAGLFMEFYSLKNSFQEDSSTGELNLLEKEIGACRSFFGKIKESQSFWEPKCTTLLRVSFAKMADEISKQLLTLSKSKFLSLSSEMRLYDAVMDAPVPADIQFCRLHGAISTFTSWLTEMVPV